MSTISSLLILSRSVKFFDILILYKIYLLYLHNEILKEYEEM
nr:MAG TPA: hypothetical protein [Caudoviricetes sp.]DAU91132.1 MAG TPA: hypothetical protein [Caudoviricetes sp.]DAW64554.1 MAG TPA: hypothetical protein [Herelleviridae sp.]